MVFATVSVMVRPDDIAFHDAGHGLDEFGLDPRWVARTERLVAPLYDRWFRVSSYDSHHVPAEGAAVLAANHSGTLPFDGAMLYVDLLRNLDPPRVVRPLADHFVRALPFIGSFFARVGVVGGSRGNVRQLLGRGELLMVFPEGTPGISKPFRDRYMLSKWRVGHAELAIRHQVPIVPVAIIGAEEQMPTLANLPVHAFGAPHLPVPAVPLPLPVHYHIYYGEPLEVAGRFDAEQSDDPVVVDGLAGEVKVAVERLIARGLAERPGVFA